MDNRLVAHQLEILLKIKAELEKYEDKEVIFSKTGDEEILVYKKSNGGYNNLIVDTDGDVEVLIIPKNRKETHSRLYKYEDVNVEELVKLL